jgi:membrane protein required for colicin V production
MTAFDFVVIGIIGLSTVFAFARGFVRVVISLVAWVIALVAAFQYAVGLGFVDRALGGVLGLARGLLIVVIGVLIAGLTTLPQQDWWRRAMFAPALVDAALSLRPWLPQAWAEQLAFPRSERKPAKSVVQAGAT